jgi:hypothetical protein
MSKFKDFIGNEVLNLAIGYLAGLLASNLVTTFFVRRGLGNLWGLTSSRDALKRDTYDWLMFISSYVIGLAVMIGVQYGMRRLRGQRTETE